MPSDVYNDRSLENLKQEQKRTSLSLCMILKRTSSNAPLLPEESYHSRDLDTGLFVPGSLL